MSILTIKKHDTVIARGGKSAGKSGKVLQVFPLRNRVVVEGLNLVKKCLRKTQDTPKGGIIDKEAPLSVSKVMLYCPSCKKGVRISRVKDGERRVRKCKKCGHSFDG